MKFLIIFALTLATALAFTGKEIKSRNIVVPAGRLEGRIIKGQKARPRQFPYQVGLLLHNSIGNSSWCGGALISHTVVLTAAHCTAGVVFVEVNLGTINRKHAKVVHKVPAKNIIAHKYWNTSTNINDIALIKIPYTRFSKYIRAIKLPSRKWTHSSFAGECAVFSGWGITSEKSTKVPIYLRYGCMPVMSHRACESILPGLVSSQLCASTYDGVSTCNGDSGGPLVVQRSKILIGLSSLTPWFGCERRLPAVFTRVSSYLDWIKRNSNVAL